MRRLRTRSRPQVQCRWKDRRSTDSLSPLGITAPPVYHEQKPCHKARRRRFDAQRTPNAGRAAWWRRGGGERRGATFSPIPALRRRMSERLAGSGRKDIPVNRRFANARTFRLKNECRRQPTDAGIGENVAPTSGPRRFKHSRKAARHAPDLPHPPTRPTRMAGAGPFPRARQRLRGGLPLGALLSALAFLLQKPRQFPGRSQPLPKRTRGGKGAEAMRARLIEQRLL